MTAALLARSTAQAVSLAMKGELLTRSNTLSVAGTKRRNQNFDSKRRSNSGLKSKDSNEEEKRIGSTDSNIVLTLADTEPTPYLKER